jgi:hypothetical protein
MQKIYFRLLTELPVCDGAIQSMALNLDGTKCALVTAGRVHLIAIVIRDRMPGTHLTNRI